MSCSMGDGVAIDQARCGADTVVKIFFTHGDDTTRGRGIDVEDVPGAGVDGGGVLREGGGSSQHVNEEQSEHDALDASRDVT